MDHQREKKKEGKLLTGPDCNFFICNGDCRLALRYALAQPVNIDLNRKLDPKHVTFVSKLCSFLHKVVCDIPSK